MNANFNAIWNASTTQSFYNSPQHAAFLSDQGECVQLRPVLTAHETAYIPVARPKVWTWWRNTKIPVPPAFGPKSSGYLGLLATDRTTSDWAPFVDALAAQANHGPRSISFIQPVLFASGVMPNLDVFMDALNGSTLPIIPTETRIIELPPLYKEVAFEFDAIIDSVGWDSLLESYDSRRRYDIRRALKLGVTIELHSPRTFRERRDLYASILPVHTESWIRTGLGPHTLAYWERYSETITESDGGADVLVIARLDGEIIGVVDAHVRGVSAYYQMNSSTITGQRASANPLMLHTAMVACNALGVRYFELGRYHTDELIEKTKSVNAYKEQFGGFTIPVPNTRI